MKAIWKRVRSEFDILEWVTVLHSDWNPDDVAVMRPREASGST